MSPMKRILAAAILLLPFVSASQEAEGDFPWSDPAFVRAFMGTYGVRAEVEPPIAEEERLAMEKVVELMNLPQGPLRAQRFLESIIKPTDSAIFDFTLANLYFQQEKNEVAVKWYDRAVKKHPSFLRAHKNLGLARVRLGLFKEALPSLTRAVELGANDAMSFGLVAYAHLMTESFASAETAYRMAILLAPETMDWKLGLMRCLFRQRKFPEAAALCAELIVRDPEKPELWIMQANAFMGMGEPRRAAENYEYMGLAGLATTETLNSLGDIHVSLGGMDLAADAYLRALELDTGNRTELFLRNAEVLAARGAAAEAVRLMEALRAKQGDGLDDGAKIRMLKLEARVASALGKSDEEQGRLLENIVALNGLDGDALLLLAQHYLRMGKQEEAYFQFQRAANLDDFRAEALLRHGQAKVRNREYREALALLQQSQELRPKDDLAKFIEQVKRIASL
jgi:tetratricopeptide (TPR) repeat protein